MSIAVQTSGYSGPADILLQLINDSDLDIFDVSISDLVDSYLAEVANMDVLDLNAATEILLTAVLMIEMKSRLLLPKPEIVAEEDIGTYDLLVARMMECKTYRAVSMVFKEMHLESKKSLPRTAVPEDHFLELMGDPLEGVRPENIFQSYQNALSSKPAPLVLDVSHIIELESKSVAEVISEISVKLKEFGVCTFKDLVEGLDRIEIVVTFLAVLELYKNSQVQLKQVKTFGEIQIEWKEAALTEDENTSEQEQRQQEGEFENG